ncbi:MAG: 50S ribosomal protein L32e [Candidatus Thorarchaeota archaeon]
MSKKSTLSDVPGVGPKMEEKLREAGVKTPLALSKSDPEKLASKVDGLSLAGAEKIVAAAKEMIPEAAPTKKETKPAKKVAEKEAKPKKEAKPEAPKAKPKKEAEPKAPEPKKAEAKKPGKETPPAKKKPEEKKEAKAKKAKPKKKEPEPEFVKREVTYDKRLFRIAQAKKRRKPKFRHEQAHRWVRISNSWRKVRGIDSATREKLSGRITLVSPGYRSPKSVRGLHPSGYEEALVHRPADLLQLDPDVHAIRIASTVGLKKRQIILDEAEMKMFKILNPGVPEAAAEEDLFEELEGLDDLEVD